MTAAPDDPGSFDPAHFDSAYYESNGQDGDRPALRWYTQMVTRYVGPGPYLDYGCGTGHLLKRLSEQGEASGFEISDYSAAVSRRTAPGCTVFTSDADIPDGSVRGLTAIHVTEHLDDETLAAVLATWRRILAPGGGALVATPDLGGRAQALAGKRWGGYDDPTHINLKTHATWVTVFTRSGFTIERQGSDGLWNVPYSGAPKIVDAARYALPGLVQFLSGRLFLPPGTGESSLFVLRRA